MKKYCDFKSGPEAIQLFFMLNSTGYEISTANGNKNAKKERVVLHSNY